MNTQAYTTLNNLLLTAVTTFLALLAVGWVTSLWGILLTPPILVVVGVMCGVAMRAFNIPALPTLETNVILLVMSTLYVWGVVPGVPAIILMVWASFATLWQLFAVE